MNGSVLVKEVWKGILVRGNGKGKGIEVCKRWMFSGLIKLFSVGF